MDKHSWKLFLLKPLFFDQKEFVAEIVVFYEMGNEMCYLNVICYISMFSNFSEWNMIPQ